MHIAIILDGNGRWAQKRHLPRAFGHRAGALRVEECVRISPDLGITELTLYAFSTENWKRSTYEVSSIFRLLRVYFARKAQELKAEDVHVRFIGRRENFSPQVRSTMEWIETLTANCNRLKLNIAIDYGGRDELLRIMRRAADDARAGKLTAAMLDDQWVASHSDLPDSSAPDLLIRTGGEKRLSNFLLWHVAYTEFEFSDDLWPDFTAAKLAAAIDKFRARVRRFGSVPSANAGR